MTSSTRSSRPRCGGRASAPRSHSGRCCWTRRGTGCALYIVNRGIEEPRRFLLYEQYVDRAAFDGHTSSEPFQRIVLGQVVPLLEERRRDYYDVIAAPGLPGLQAPP